MGTSIKCAGDPEEGGGQRLTTFRVGGGELFLLFRSLTLILCCYVIKKFLDLERCLPNMLQFNQPVCVMHISVNTHGYIVRDTVRSYVEVRRRLTHFKLILINLRNNLNSGSNNCLVHRLTFHFLASSYQISSSVVDSQALREMVKPSWRLLKTTTMTNRERD